MTYGGIVLSMTILQHFAKIQELLAFLALPNQSSRLETTARFLAGEHNSGLLEAFKVRRKNRCFETRFGSTDGDDISNYYD
jgi:hypothetical protein